MALRQVIKYKRKNSPEKLVSNIDYNDAGVYEMKTVGEKKNNFKKTEEAMDEKINKAEEIMNNMKAANHIKVVKKDKGLIERTESSKIVLTEDNRQVLND